jgi:hypothetical protein
MIMKKQLIFFTVFLTSSAFTTVQGAEVTHSFNSGDPARASEVNQNFQDLADAIDANDTDIADLKSLQSINYDYRDYVTASNITQKTFSVTAGYDANSSVSDFGDCIATSTIWNYRHGNDGGTPTTSLILIAQNSFETCTYVTRNFRSESDYLVFTGYTFHDPADTSSILDAYSFSNGGLKLLSRAVQLGDTLGDAVIRTKEENGRAQITSNTYTAVRMENATVPYGSFTDCLVVQAEFRTESFRVTKSLEWRCPGVGVVKRIRHGTYENGVYELTGMTMTP